MTTGAALREYTTVDKSDWGDGPWNDEPDKIQWVDEATGLDCLIVRNHRYGNLCGYVGVPPGHPHHGADYESPDVDVHGGLTYAARCADTDDESKGICHVPEPGRPADVWWLGFDCGHGFDISPGMDAHTAALGMPPLRFGGESYKDVAYVRGEVTRLAQQLACA